MHVAQNIHCGALVPQSSMVAADGIFTSESQAICTRHGDVYKWSVYIRSALTKWGIPRRIQFGAVITWSIFSKILLVVILKSDLLSTTVIAVSYVISW